MEPTLILTADVMDATGQRVDTPDHVWFGAQQYKVLESRPLPSGQLEMRVEPVNY